MSNSVNHYVEQRAVLLANLVLTRRKDLEVHPLNEPQDTGIDLLVRITSPVLKGQFFASFGVEVKGTSESLPDEQAATAHANKLWKHRPAQSFFLSPVVALLFSVEDDRGYFGWLMKPEVAEEQSPTLSRVFPLGMTKISRKGVDGFIAEVEKWFEAMAEMLSKPVPAT